MSVEAALQQLHQQQQQQQQQQHATEAANPLMRGGGYLLNYDSRYGSLDPTQLLGAGSSLDGANGSAQPLLTAAAAAAAFGSTVGLDMLVDQPIGRLSAGGVSRLCSQCHLGASVRCCAGILKAAGMCLPCPLSPLPPGAPCNTLAVPLATAVGASCYCYCYCCW
jgi:hypothetical protein